MDWNWKQFQSILTLTLWSSCSCQNCHNSKPSKAKQRLLGSGIILGSPSVTYFVGQNTRAIAAHTVHHIHNLAVEAQMMAVIVSYDLQLSCLSSQTLINNFFALSLNRILCLCVVCSTLHCVSYFFYYENTIVWSSYIPWGFSLLWFTDCLGLLNHYFIQFMTRVLLQCVWR